MTRPSFHLVTVVVIVLAAGAAPAPAQDFPHGTIIDDVKCADDATQRYALYLPSKYSRDRLWNLASVRAMSADLGQRFVIDKDRLYVTGMSGGARVALQVALNNSNIAGVIASSAGFPDNKPRTSVSFPIFATAGSDDFNYLEMRQLDRKLTSPHRLAVFNGGHTLPPVPIALEAIEWMVELKAIQSGRRMRDDGLVERLFAKQQRLLAEATSSADTVHRLDAIVADFKGLRDVSAEAARAAQLSRMPEVRNALAREREDDDAEQRAVNDILNLEAGLRDENRHAPNLIRLRDQLSRYAQTAGGEVESPERSRARRVLRVVISGASERVDDRQYLQLLDELRRGAPAR